jgi:hypothetical protein
MSLEDLERDVRQRLDRRDERQPYVAPVEAQGYAFVAPVDPDEPRSAQRDLHRAHVGNDHQCSVSVVLVAEGVRQMALRDKLNRAIVGDHGHVEMAAPESDEKVGHRMLEVAHETKSATAQTRISCRDPQTPLSDLPRCNSVA